MLPHKLSHKSVLEQESLPHKEEEPEDEAELNNDLNPLKISQERCLPRDRADDNFVRTEARVIGSAVLVLSALEVHCESYCVADDVQNNKEKKDDHLVAHGSWGGDLVCVHI